MITFKNWKRNIPCLTFYSFQSLNTYGGDLYISNRTKAILVPHYLEFKLDRLKVNECF